MPESKPGRVLLGFLISNLRIDVMRKSYKFMSLSNDQPNYLLLMFSSFTLNILKLDIKGIKKIVFLKKNVFLF
jgi:hypothetical protein